MRVTFGTKYNQMNYYQSTMQEKLTDINTKIASGLKIQYGYQDSSVFNQNLKLEHEELALEQGIDNSNTAFTRTLNTDKALSELSQTALQFKTKLIQAANDIHSPISREAIARDLQKLKEHMLNIANTSIGGEFLFAGSNVKTRPFDDDGTYKGNNERLETLISSKNLMPYNITGKELFFGRDSDGYKSITTNIKKYNHSLLNPDIMDKIKRGEIPQEVYIQATDTLRDLIGDDDKDPSNNGKEFFYMRGVRPDGTSFKSKFALDVGYSDEKNATRVQDLLDRIGREFGNTSQNKVVDVGLNFWGQIEIKNLDPGNANLDFHLISSDADVENIDEIAKSKGRITSYTKSPFMTTFSQSSLDSIRDNYDHRISRIPSVFFTKDNALATFSTKLRDLFPEEIDTLVFAGTRPNTDDGKIDPEPIEPLQITIDDSMQVRDLLKEIDLHFGGRLRSEIINGELVFQDNNVGNAHKDTQEPPFNAESGFSIKLSTLSQGVESNGLRSDHKTEYDRLSFDNRGSKLLSNVQQILKSGAGFASGESKLVDVAGGSVDGQVYNLDLSDHNGKALQARIELSNKDGSFLIISGNATNADSEIKIPLFSSQSLEITKADDVTYRQLMDAIGIALNFTNNDMQQYALTQVKPNTKPTQEAKNAYEELLRSSKTRLEVDLNAQGKMVISDTMRSVSRMQFMIYNAQSNDFSPQALRDHTSLLTFNANNALTIDQPDVNMFEGIDEIIQAVRSGIYRPDGFGDGYDKNMRNIGVQNGIELFDHFSNHIEKMLAQNGAHTRSFENAIRRNEVLRVQLASIKTDNIGTDIAKTYNHFSNLTTNYNAVLSSTNRINQMSLVNYL